jgi:hypothetical protein
MHNFCYFLYEIYAHRRILTSALGGDVSGGIVTRLRAGRPRIRGSILGRARDFFPFSITSIPALGPAHPTQWVLGVKQLEPEADNTSM